MSRTLNEIKQEIEYMLDLAYKGNEQHPAIIYKYGFLLGFLCRLAFNDTSVLVSIRNRIKHLTRQIKGKQ